MADSAESAVKLFKEEIGRIRLLITDVHLPQMSGETFGGGLSGAGQRVAGRFYRRQRTASFSGGRAAFSAKPFSPQELIERVETAFA